MLASSICFLRGAALNNIPAPPSFPRRDDDGIFFPATSLRCFLLTVALMLCSVHLLAQSNFYKIERPVRFEEGTSEAGSPEKKVLAVLEVTDGELGFSPDNIQGLAGISATRLDYSEIWRLVADSVPHVQVRRNTLFIFNEELFTFLYNGAAILKGVNKKNASDVPPYNASITLNTASVQNPKVMKLLEESLRSLGRYGVSYLMTEFIHGDDGRVHILFEMWVPKKQKNQVLELLARYNFEMKAMKPEERRRRQGSASYGTIRTIPPGTASGERASAGTAPIIDPEVARRAIEAVAGRGLGAMSQMATNKP